MSQATKTPPPSASAAPYSGTEDLLRLACRAAGMGLWSWDMATDAVTGSAEAEAICGFGPGGFPKTRKAFHEMIHPQDREGVVEYLDTCARERRSTFTRMLRVVRPDGALRWLDVRGELQTAATGEPTRLAGVLVDCTERKKFELTVRKVVSETAQTGTSFLQALVRTLAEALGVKYAFVGELLPGTPQRAFARAVWAHAAPAPSFEYALAGTPCANVAAGAMCYYPAQVQSLFPAARLLIDMEVSCYLGIPLISAAGKTLGLLAVLNDRPLDPDLQPDSILRLFAERAGAELERVRAEVALQETAHRLRAIVESTPTVAIHTYDPAGRVVGWNPAAVRMFGFTAAEAAGQTIDQLIGTPAEAERFLQTLGGIASSGQAHGPVEGQFLRKDGTLGWRLTTTFAIGQPGTTADQFACMDVDISERKQAEDSLRHSQQFIERIAMASPHAIYVFDLQSGETVYANDKTFSDIGCTRAEAMAQGPNFLAHYLHPDDLARMPALLKRWENARDGEVLDTEYRLRHADGSWRWFHGRDTVFGRSANGRVRRIIGAAEDITDRREALAQLRESEQRYRTLVENAPEAQVVLDLDKGTFIEVNPVAEQLFGMTRAELLRSGPQHVSAPFQPDGVATAEAARERLQAALNGAIAAFRWTHRNKAGEDIPCEVRLVRLPSSDRRLIRGSITDITERLQMEERLRQATKMESIGRLAGGIAHDFNNLLTSILGYTALAKEQITDAGARRHLEAVLLAGQRGAELTAQLLAFARRQVISPRDVNLNEAIGDSERLLRRVLGEPIELITVAHPDAPVARVDPGQLSQVVINLAINARDAMPKGGRLTLETGFATLDERYAARFSDVKPGRYAVLSVSDTGLGISAEHQRRLFEPFFTTKGPGQGTGLGLATCYGIVKQHQGHLTVYSEIGRGTTFKVYLPEASGRAADEPPALAPELTTGQETIYVCEDDTLLCDLTREILAGNGYQVVAALTATELLAQAEANTGALDLLITDLVMPDLSGPELARRMAALRPGLKILYVSGYTENVALQQGDLGKGVRFLQKPFTLADLTRTVREILDRPPAN